MCAVPKARRFTQEQLDDRGVQILKDGKIVHIRDLRKGDQVTATFISEPPVVVTETEVQATLAPGASPPAAAPTQTAAAAPAPAPPHRGCGFAGHRAPRPRPSSRKLGERLGSGTS
jgi:hypothetical protein